MDTIASSSSLEYNLTSDLGRTLVPPFFPLYLYLEDVADYPRRPVDTGVQAIASRGAVGPECHPANQS
jgi:hypothetical protein